MRSNPTDNYSEPAAGDRSSLAALFTGLTREISTLIRQEVALARTEVAEKVGQVKAAIVSLGAGGALLLVGLFFLFQALAFGVAALLENWLDARVVVWLAPLLVGALALLIGGAVLRSGLSNLASTDLAPRRTADTLRRDKDLVKEHTR
jgi:Putative Actinobacterial Holin-X, holin superfamily III